MTPKNEPERHFILCGSPAPVYRFKQKTRVKFACRSASDNCLSNLNRADPLACASSGSSARFAPIDVHGMLQRIVKEACRNLTKSNVPPSGSVEQRTQSGAAFAKGWQDVDTSSKASFSETSSSSMDFGPTTSRVSFGDLCCKRNNVFVSAEKRSTSSRPNTASRVSEKTKTNPPWRP